MALAYKDIKEPVNYWRTTETERGGLGDEQELHSFLEHFLAYIRLCQTVLLLYRTGYSDPASVPTLGDRSSDEDPDIQE